MDDSSRIAIALRLKKLNRDSIKENLVEDKEQRAEGLLSIHCMTTICT